MMNAPTSVKTFKPSDPHVCMDPEKVEKNVVYSFTINPNDANQYFEKTDRLGRFRDNLYGKLLLNLAPYAKYDIYIEISKKGRLHGHGTIEIIDILNFYLKSIPYLMDFCSYEMDTIASPEVWLKYCTKQSHLFAKSANPKVTHVSDPIFVINKTGSKIEYIKTQKTLEHYGLSTRS